MNMAEASRGGLFGSWGISPSLPIVLVGICVLLYRLYIRHFPKPIPGNIPYNKQSAGRLIGDSLEIRRYQKAGDFRRFFHDHNTKLNTSISQVFMFPYPKPFVLLTDFREAYDILSKRHRDFDRSKRNADIFGTIGTNFHLAMQTRDPRFKGNKELVRDLMAPAFLNEVSAVHIYDIATVLVDMWSYKVAQAVGRPFSAYEDLHCVALDIILAAAFGIPLEQSTTQKQYEFLQLQPSKIKSAGSKDDPVTYDRTPIAESRTALMKVTETVVVGYKSPFPRLHHWILRNTIWRRDFALKEEFITDEINKGVERLTSDNKQENRMRCAMDMMLLREFGYAKKEGRKPNINSPRMRDELFGYVATGHDTSSTTLSWITKFLADNQSAQAKLRRQIRTAFAEAHAEKRQPTVMEIIEKPAPFLDAFLEECLRMTKTIPTILRETLTDVTILGHLVPKGTSIMMYNHGPGGQLKSGFNIPEAVRSDTSQASKDRVGEWNTEDISQFRPERWLQRTAEAKSDGEGGAEFEGIEYNANSGPFLTFGGGPRGCFGKKLAYMELRIVMAMLVWNFEFQPCPAELSSYEGIDAATVVPKQCYVRLKHLL
ncbi:cytochrome P450 monooxygenase [Trichoderma harzianum]|uniref:Cytochrome P450 monooxygenase n=1 Tax=Trichoderma harzianum TaxID=5544 RepID=A0A0F9XLX4_TRIHA|nr:cytochrome P450 monooxygenase [Trichoderma harzianum]